MSLKTNRIKNIRLLDILLYISISLWVFPSGTILGLPLKSMVYLASFSLIIISIYRHNIKLKFIDVSLLIVFFRVILWYCYGVINEYENGSNPEIVSFFSLIIVVFNYYIFFKYFSKPENIIIIRNIVYLTTLLFVGFKIVIEIFFLLKIIDFDTCGNIFRNTLGAQTMMLPIKFGSSVFSRIGNPNDVVPLVVLSVDLVCEKRSLFSRLLIFILFSFFVLIVYSRIVFVQFALCYLLAVLTFGMKNNKNKIVIASFILTIVLFLLTNSNLQRYVPSDFSDFFSTRFSGNQVEFSDGIRQTQINYLSEGFWNNFFIGNGLGSYVREYIRSYTNPGSYEVEYMSFLYQFGIVGFSLIIVYLVIVFYNYTVNIAKDRFIKIVIVFNFGFWAIKPFFNPQFLSSMSGMIIVFLMLFSYYYNLTENNG